MQASREFQDEEKRRLKERQERLGREGNHGDAPPVQCEDTVTSEPRPEPPEIPEDLREELEDEELESDRKRQIEVGASHVNTQHMICI